MLRSMTGFASTQSSSEQTHLIWEIRTVNHRYLDITIRLPDRYRMLEGALREKVKSMISRGKVDIQLKLKEKSEITKKLMIDLERIKGITTAIQQAGEPFSGISSLSWGSLIALPNVLIEEEVTDLSEDLIIDSIDAPLQKIIENREKEGAYLQRMIEERLIKLQGYHQRLEKNISVLSDNVKQKLLTRCGELAEVVSEDRLLQEVAILLTKMDVAEELDRLGSHFQQIHSAIRMEEPIGRRLDFLMQELSREVNTLGVKIEDSEVRSMTVDMKVLVEQMREQIQNVE